MNNQIDVPDDKMRELDSKTTLQESQHPRIANRCPYCGSASLFIGNGGWLTCGNLSTCKRPTLNTAIAYKVVEARAAEAAIWVEAVRLAHYWLSPPSGEPQAALARDVLRNALHAADGTDPEESPS